MDGPVVFGFVACLGAMFSVVSTGLRATEKGVCAPSETWEGVARGMRVIYYHRFRFVDGEATADLWRRMCLARFVDPPSNMFGFAGVRFWSGLSTVEARKPDVGTTYHDGQMVWCLMPWTAPAWLGAVGVVVDAGLSARSHPPAIAYGESGLFVECVARILPEPPTA